MIRPGGNLAAMSREDRSILGWGAFAVAIAALCLALFGMRDDGDASASDDGTAAAAVAQAINIELSDFAITPDMPTVKPGATTVHLTNTGSMVHNFSVPDLAIMTPDIPPGSSYD